MSENDKIIIELCDFGIEKELSHIRIPQDALDLFAEFIKQDRNNRK